MSKRARDGYVTLTLEIPIEIAEWLGTHGESLGQMARVAVTQARYNSEIDKASREERSKKHQVEFWALGRLGYRQLRKAGVSKNLTNNRDITKTVAANLGVSWQALEFAVTRFKRSLNDQIRKRRGREIGRLYWAGYGNEEIARRFNVHPNTVARYIREVIKPTGRRA